MTHPPEPQPLFDAAIRVLHSYLCNHNIDDCYADRICATISQLASERDAALANVGVLREALAHCAEQFRFYERNHLAKTPPDLEKAQTNHDMAEAAEKTISNLPAAAKALKVTQTEVWSCE